MATVKLATQPYEEKLSMATTEHWTDAPDEHDYPAAEDYLSLLTIPNVAHQVAKRLETAPLQHHKAKDLLRAASLPVLDPSNVHVAKDLAKVKNGTPLSPVLLVRGELARVCPSPSQTDTTESAPAITSMKTRTSRAGSSTPEAPGRGRA